MKKLLLSIFLFTALTGNAQVLSETFQGADFPPLGWTTSTNVPARPWGFTTVIFSPSGQTTFNITDGKSAAIGWIAQNQIADLTSPTFSLVGYSSATFAFNTKLGYEYMVAPFNAGNLEAQISTNGGTVWTTLWVEENQGVYDDYVTLAISLNLAAYVGQSNLKIRFYYTGNDADSVSVDDVLISGTLGVNDVLSSSFKTFPNPVNNVVNITNSENISLSEVSITDINGRTVKSINVNNVSEIQINVSDLNAGVYFMNINSTSGKAVKKFIKN